MENQADLITAEFEQAVQEFIDLDNTITQAMNDLKKLRDKKNELNTYIIDYMKKYTIEGVNITGGQLRLTSRKSKKSVNEKTLSEAFIASGLFNDEKVATELAKNIYKNREVIEVPVLNRSVDKPKKGE